MKTPDHPTPQPSGRTAKEILEERFSSWECDVYRKIDDPLRNVDMTQRQLFNAICSEVIGEDEPRVMAPLANVVIDSHNELRAELRERLRVFFNQAEASGKDGGK